MTSHPTPADLGRAILYSANAYGLACVAVGAASTEGDSVREAAAQARADRHYTAVTTHVDALVDRAH